MPKAHLAMNCATTNRLFEMKSYFPEMVLDSITYMMTNIKRWIIATYNFFVIFFAVAHIVFQELRKRF